MMSTRSLQTLLLNSETINKLLKLFVYEENYYSHDVCCH